MNLTPTLDAAHAALQDPDAVPFVLPELVRTLQAAKDESPSAEWARLEALCLRHPLRRLLHQDPLTARAFQKPRGYAGDAGIIDLMYRHPWGAPLIEAATPLGRALHAFVAEGPIPRAIRDRRQIAADALDEVAERVPGAHVLSVACGHLREAELSTAVADGRFGRFVGFDQDAESLAEVARTCPGVERVQDDIRSLLDRTTTLSGTFDLIYSTGLYDYLEVDVATRLTGELFTRLRPGGRLLLANLLREGEEVGYTEAIMDWHLVYRDEEELRALGAGIPARELARTRILDEPARRVAFVEFERR